jgi:hypothetical protein
LKNSGYPIPGTKHQDQEDTPSQVVYCLVDRKPLATSNVLRRAGRRTRLSEAEDGTQVNWTPYPQFLTRISKVWYVPEVVAFAPVVEAETDW